MPEREIALDTETTGLSPSEGHRIVEIGCVELVGRLPTGNTYHTYLNPKRDMPKAAFEVHGLSTEFLQDKPFFSAIVDDFLSFIGTSTLIIHNAQFDVGFINAELDKIEKAKIPMTQTFCTLEEARKRFPGAPASLDALCKRFDIDVSARTKHGALLDAELLADMYLELMGGNQTNLVLEQNISGVSINEASEQKMLLKPRPHTVTSEEEQQHKEFLKKIKDPIWAN